MAGRLPDEIIHRRKQGFAIRSRAGWPQSCSRWRASCYRPTVRQRDFNAHVTRLLDEHVARRHDHRQQLWSLLCFQLCGTIAGCGSGPKFTAIPNLRLL